jgi:hypothetical protein
MLHDSTHSRRDILSDVEDEKRLKRILSTSPRTQGSVCLEYSDEYAIYTPAIHLRGCSYALGNPYRLLAGPHQFWYRPARALSAQLHGD